VKRYINGFIITGMIILSVVFLAVMIPSAFTNKNPYTTNTLDGYSDETGHFVFRTAPFEPDGDYFLGTDSSGRDVWSFILYGTRLTLSVAILVTMLRFLLALIFGISAGFDRPISSVVVEQFNSVFNAIPPVLMCILVLSIPYFKTFSKSASTMVFILVLTLVEWGRSGELVKARVQAIRKKDFIKSEIAIGKHPIQIIISNILPHLLPELTVLFFMEIARVLTVLMQLGIFNIFIGNLRIVASTDQGNIVGKATSYEPEWSSMLGSAKNAIRSAPWIVFSSAGAFFFVVLGFNLLGEGIRRQLDKLKVAQFTQKESMFGLIGFVSIILFILLPLFMTGMPYHSFKDGDQVVALDQNYAEAGNIPQKDYVISRLKALDIVPVPKLETYEQPFSEVDYNWVSQVDIKVGSEVITDYELHSYQAFSGAGYVVDLRKVDLTALSKEQIDEMAGKYILINDVLFDLTYYADKILSSSDALGVIALSEHVDNAPKMGINKQDGVVITLPMRYEKILMQEKLSIHVESEALHRSLTNIVGLIKGHSDENEPEAIMIGFDLNYEDKEEATERFTFIFNLLQQIKANEDRLTKSVVVVFWDGNALGDASGKQAYASRHYYPIKHSEFYIEMTNMTFDATDKGTISMDQHLISMAKPAAMNFTNLLSENFESQKVTPVGYIDNHFREPFYYKWGIPTLYLSYNMHSEENSDTEKRSAASLTPEALGNILIESMVFELY